MDFLLRDPHDGGMSLFLPYKNTKVQEGRCA